MKIACTLFFFLASSVGFADPISSMNDNTNNESITMLTSNWSEIGGVLSSAVNLASDDQGVIHAVTRGERNRIWYKTKNNAQWSNWQYLGGIGSSAPSIAVDGESIAVSTIGIDNNAYIKIFNNGCWSDWTNVGGIAFSSPGLTFSENTLIISVRGNDNRAWLKSVPATNSCL